MSGEALKEEIRKGADVKASLALTEARAKAEQILAEAQIEAERMLETRLQDAQRHLENVEKSEAAKARMECTRRILGLQSRYIEQAFSEAEAGLKRLPVSDPTRYGNLLAKYTREALQELGGASLVALVRESDRKLVEGILRTLREDPAAGGPTFKVSVSDEPLRASGGIVIRTADERAYFVNTFESRILRAREELRAGVTDTLLGRE